MKRICLFILLLTVKCFSDVKIEEKKLVILGDSLAEGYGVAQSAAFPALLQKKIDADKINWKIQSAGSSGSTTASALQRLKWIAKEKPKLILLILGNNDGLRGLKTTETEKNLSLAVQWAQQEKISILLGQLYMPPNYGEKYTKDFSQVYKSIAEKYKIPLLPFLLETIAGKPEFNLADGIHPNELGHKKIAELMYLQIKKYLK